MKKKYSYRILFLIILTLLSISSACYAEPEIDFSLGKTIMRLILNIFIFICIIVFAIYGTRFIAKRSEKYISSKHMKIIDVLRLNSNIKIAIVTINKKAYILGITNNTIKVLDKFIEDELELNVDGSFEDELLKQKYEYLKKNKYIDKLQQKVQELSSRFNKLLDEEENDNEKMD